MTLFNTSLRNKFSFIVHLFILRAYIVCKKCTTKYAKGTRDHTLLIDFCFNIAEVLIFCTCLEEDLSLAQ